MTEKFEFKNSYKKPLYIMMALGVVGMLIAFFFYGCNKHSRFWTNLLLNTYFFTGIGIFGIFFVAANQLGYSGWIALVKRTIQSLSGAVKWMAIPAAIIVGGVFFKYHNLYDHWSLEEHRQHLDSTKQAFLSPVFWAIRIAVYYFLWIFLGDHVIRFFNRNDANNPGVYKRSKLWAAAWIVVFAVSESFVSWDLIMSTDPHWYSTLFGWYNFASYACAGFAFTILFVAFLKSQGYLTQVKIDHVHDIGKYMFAFSIFWTYLWFSQFMLQWYGNIPEDTKYWVKRFDVPLFKVTVFLALAINFLTPLLLFIKRDNKRNLKFACTIAVIVIFGHYLDFYNMVMYEPNVCSAECCSTEAKPEHHAALNATSTAMYAENTHATEAHPTEMPATDAVATHESGKAEASAENHHATEKHCSEEKGCSASSTCAGFGLPEILMFIGFLGVFIYFFFNRLSKDELIPVNDPYIKESLKHHVEYA